MFGLSLVSQLPLLRSQSCLLVAPLCAVGSAIVASPADTRPAIPTTHPHPHAPQARRCPPPSARAQRAASPPRPSPAPDTTTAPLRGRLVSGAAGSVAGGDTLVPPPGACPFQAVAVSWGAARSATKRTDQGDPRTR